MCNRLQSAVRLELCSGLPAPSEAIREPRWRRLVPFSCSDAILGRLSRRCCGLTCICAATTGLGYIQSGPLNHRPVGDAGFSVSHLVTTSRCSQAFQSKARLQLRKLECIRHVLAWTDWATVWFSKFPGSLPAVSVLSANSRTFDGTDHWLRCSIMTAIP